MVDRIRCAIYTRKSTEEGLEQEFNSLDAQYESCVAYIQSQAIEGWELVPVKYDDGGISGGTLNRPALQQLLADIKAGLVDRIVVYKIDRLTRCLSDFSKIVDILDATGATFVSVTQSFNTATSMGRLTLNMLLSFAQFEREVTAERIRDKFKASKQKGMFMGGAVPMGYVVKDRHLYIDPNGSETVKQVFNAYLAFGCLTKVEDWLKANHIKTPVWVSRNGNSKGGRPFSYGHIHAVLTNPIYIGKVKHYDAIYDGQHDRIINDDIWEQVQTSLQSKASVNRNQKYQTGKHCLAGIIYGETGDRLTPSGSNKNGVRHRYYVSSRISKGNAKEYPDAWRLPATTLETLILKTVRHHIESSLWTNDISTADNIKCKISALFSQDNWARYISKITVHGRKVKL